MPLLSYRSANRAKGFTLVEILVASFILFLVISATTMIYRSALLSSFKAEKVLRNVSMVDPVREQIKDKLMGNTSSEVTGRGQMGGISYSWVARQVKQAQAQSILDIESGQLRQGIHVFTLWNVSLQLNIGDAVRQYSFNEVSW